MSGLLRWLVTDASSDQYGAVVDAVEGGGAAAALDSVVESAIGAIPDGGVTSAIYFAIIAYRGTDTGGGDNIVPIDFGSFVRVELLIAHIEAGNVTISPALEEHLADAARNAGPAGVVNVMRDPEGLSDADAEALAEIEAVIEEQADRAEADHVEDLERIFGAA